MKIVIIPPHDGDTEDPNDFARRLAGAGINAQVAYRGKDQHAVVLWRFDRHADQDGTLEQIERDSPVATLLVYTKGRVNMGSREALVSNSPLRLRRDVLDLRDWLAGY